MTLHCIPYNEDCYICNSRLNDPFPQLHRKHAGYEHAEPDATGDPAGGGAERSLQDIAEQDAHEHLVSPQSIFTPRVRGITGATRHEDAP